MHYFMTRFTIRLHYLSLSGEIKKKSGVSYKGANAFFDSGSFPFTENNAKFVDEANENHL